MNVVIKVKIFLNKALQRIILINFKMSICLIVKKFAKY